MTDIEYDALVEEYEARISAVVDEFRKRGLETGDLLDIIERNSSSLIETLAWDEFSARKERQMGRQAT